MAKEKDQFINIAAGGKKLTGEIKRLKEIQPLVFKHKLIDKSSIQVSIRDEKNEETLYKEFLKEKDELKKKLTPFLKKYSDNIPQNSIEICKFKYREETDEDKKDFGSVLKGKGQWKDVVTPHYIGKEGKWNCFYRTIISIDSIDLNKEYILRLESVDYECDVYLNGRLVTRHIGFFAPFEADLTSYLLQGENVVLLVVKNDFTTSGISVNGKTIFGDKIYAKTNIGCDEPSLGWHHCPAGAGIIGKIELITSNKVRVTDCFVRPNIDNGDILVSSTIACYDKNIENFEVFYSVDGRNFKKNVFKNKPGKVDQVQFGNNYFLEKFNLKDFRIWDVDSPWLYDLTILVRYNGQIIEQYQTHFGMRKFTMDLNSKPLKGAFYFNNERIMLRGTNEMGHLTRAVMEKNFDQLIDDILIAKVANLNYYRITQRPTLKTVYDYLDMLGMLCQTDFPLFSYLTYSAVGEAYKQVNEMERLTRNHPSIILETFCNETLDKTAWGKEAYVLSRYEMEDFFNVSRGIVESINPDRVIKYNEGDYAPIEDTYGISDFHCYNMWYVSHGLPSGKLRKGYLPPIRKDYMCGCGEFGVDGLDSFKIMEKYAPKEWLPKSLKESWSPKIIAKSQCFQLHGDFFPEQSNINDWIKESRKFQATAIKEYVNDLRLRSDYIESTAVHLLIDAWPMGWTKTLVDVDRTPKPAFYTFKEASIKTRVFLRRDKFVIYQNDNAFVEVYVFNDQNKAKNVRINISVYYRNNVENYSVSGEAKPVGTTYFGDVKIKAPKDFVGAVTVVSEMISDNAVTYDRVNFEIKNNLIKNKEIPLIYSDKLVDLKLICDGKVNRNIIFTDSDYYSVNKAELEKLVYSGGKVVVFADKPFKVLDENIIFKTHTLEEEVRANNLIFSSDTNDYTKEFKTYDFMNFYNKEKDYQDLTAWFKFYCPKMKEILYTLEDIDKSDKSLNKAHKLIMGELDYGKGKIVVSTMSCLNGCIGINPILDKFLINLIEK